MPLSKKDKVLAEDEYRSLRYLGKHWSDNGTHYINVLDFLKEFVFKKL